jgi:hypothetical protein
LFEIRLGGQTLVHLAHQATIRRNSSSLEIDLQGAVEREVKWLIFYLTH